MCVGGRFDRTGLPVRWFGIFLMPEMALRVSSLFLTEQRKLPFRDVWVDWGIFFLHDNGKKEGVLYF